jgi:hypothetical protein
MTKSWFGPVIAVAILAVSSASAAPKAEHLEFDGIDDYVSGVGNYNFGSGDFSFEAWVRVADLDNVDRKIFHYNLSPGGTAVWHVRQDGPKLVFNTWNGGWQGVVTVDDVFGDTGWHHIATVRTGSAVAVYVDGVLATTSGNVAASLQTSSSNTYYIGSRESSEYWNGDIDEVRIWSRALSLLETRSRSRSDSSSPTSTKVPARSNDPRTSR